MVEAVKAAAVGVLGPSWRTTAAGVAGLVAALCGLVLVPMWDADPATLPNWGAFAAAAATSLGLVAARDNGVRSEQVLGPGQKP